MGEVLQVLDEEEAKGGGNCVWVRVLMDICKPLCRERAEKEITEVKVTASQNCGKRAYKTKLGKGTSCDVSSQKRIMTALGKAKCARCERPHYGSIVFKYGNKDKVLHLRISMGRLFHMHWSLWKLPRICPSLVVLCSKNGFPTGPTFYG